MYVRMPELASKEKKGPGGEREKREEGKRMRGKEEKDRKREGEDERMISA